MNIEKILKNVPEKSGENKNTTSLKWKKDLIEFLQGKKLDKCLEIGTCHGQTTKILADIFNEVWTVEFNFNRLNKAKSICQDKSNINFIQGDAYNENTYVNFPKYFDLAIIDCIHEYNNVIQDINQSLKFIDKKIYLAFDDYGHPEHPGVRRAIDDCIKQGLKLEKYIGENEGFTVTRSNGTFFTLNYHEGIILSYEL